MPFGFVFTNFTKKIFKHLKFTNIGKLIKCILFGESFSNLEQKNYIQTSHLSYNLDSSRFNLLDIKEDLNLLMKI